MAEPHLDHPGDVTWFAGKGPKAMTGRVCEHACDHNFTCGTVAWGPDHEHYSLAECSECGCRAWAAEYPAPNSPQRPKHRFAAFLRPAGTP